MSREKDQDWQASNSQQSKHELKMYMNDKVADQMRKCKIKPAADILRQNQKQIVELLVECYENAPENKLVEYVWGFIKPDSKFIEIKYLIVELAENLKTNHPNVLDKKMLLEKTAVKRSSKTRSDDDISDSPPKRCMVRDTRPMNPFYVPPKSMQNDVNHGRVRLLLAAVKSNSSKCLSPNVVENGTTSTSIPVTNKVPTKLSSANGAKNAVYSTTSKSSDTSSITKNISSPAQVSHLQQQPPSRKTSGLLSGSNSSSFDCERLNSSSPSPQSSAKEGGNIDDNESEEDFHVSRQRHFIYYERHSAALQSKSSEVQQSSNRDNAEGLLDEDEEQVLSNDTVAISQTQMVSDSESQPIVEENNDKSDNDIHFLRPRNLNRYNATSSIPSNIPQKQPVVISIYYDNSDDEAESLAQERRTRIRFDEENAVDNEHTPKNIDERATTWGTTLQPHETIDFEYKVNMEGLNPSGCLVAFPNQQGLCRKPEYHLLENWVSLDDYEDKIEKAVSAFSCSQYFNTQEQSPEHLFIFDSMLSGVPFQKTYKKTECIDCVYPNNPFNIINYLKTEIAEKRNDYAIKNIFICIGLDFLTHDPDLERALENVSNFFEEFLNQIIKAFDPNGPKRYKKVSKKSYFNEDSFLAIIPPRLVFITIPHVKSYNKVLNKEISKMNKLIRHFVGECKEAAARKGLQLELYDWGAESSKYDQCNIEHLGKRNDILMKYLSRKCAVFMYKPGEKQPSL